MKKLLSIFLIAIIFTSCVKKAEKKMITSNNNFHVELLFEHEGCKVYRFLDDGYKYYTTCEGSVEWSHKEGKTNKYDSIQTTKNY